MDAKQRVSSKPEHQVRGEVRHCEHLKNVGKRDDGDEPRRNQFHDVRRQYIGIALVGASTKTRSENAFAMYVEMSPSFTKLIKLDKCYGITNQ